MSELTAEVLKTIGLLFLAFIGGIFGYIYRELAMGKKLGFLRVLFAGLTAVFFAYLIKVAAIKFNWDLEYAILAVGLLSWFGADVTANFLMKMVLKRLGIGYGYFNIQRAEIPPAPGSCDYLRADVYPTVAKVRESEFGEGEEAVRDYYREQR